MKDLGRKLSVICAAAVMLAGGSAVPVSAADGQSEAVTAVSYQLMGSLSKPSVEKVQKGSSAVKLTWKRVKKATGYKVFMKTENGWKCKKTLFGGDKLSYKIEGLNARTAYTFRIQAFKKSKGKTYYSRYSAPVNATTLYGVGKTNWENPYMSARFSSKVWEAEGDKTMLSLSGGTVGQHYDLSFDAERVLEGEVVTTETLVQQVIDIYAHFGYEFTREENVEICGVKFAKVTGVIEVYDPEDTHDVVTYYLKSTGKKMFVFSEQYSQETEDACKKEIDKVWKTVTIKK